MIHWMTVYALLVVQVTLVTVIAGIAYLVMTRGRLAIAKRFLGFTLFLVLGMTATALLPLPGSWSVTTWLPKSAIGQSSELRSDQQSPIGLQVQPDASEESEIRIASVTSVATGLGETGSLPALEPTEAGNPRTIALVLLFAIGGIILSVRLIRCLWSTYRLVKRSTKVQDVALLELAEEIRLAIGCRHVEVRVSDELAGGGTVGWFRPLLIIAADWQQWSEREQRALLAHELAHVRSHDYLTGAVARIARGLYFYHPLVRWLTAAFFLAQETAADARAASLVGGRANYLVALSQIALRQDRQFSRGPVIAFASSTSTLLTRRIEVLELTDAPLSRRMRLIHQIAVGCLCLVAVAASTLRLPAQASQAVSVDTAAMEGMQEARTVAASPAADPDKEITDSFEKRALARQMLDSYRANSEAIRTWTGEVSIETMSESRSIKVTTRATVNFWSDERSHSNKTIKEVHECFEEHANGARRDRAREDDAVLLIDGKTYCFPIRFNPDSPDQPSSRKLHVGQDLAEVGLDRYFFPDLGFMNDGAYRGYFTKTYFPSLARASDEALLKIRMWRKGNLVTVVDKLITDGQLVLANTRVFDLDRASNLVRYEHEVPYLPSIDRWKCEYQQVDGVWIPKRTESTTDYRGEGQRLKQHKMTDWTDQVLNGDVATELSPAKLGARRGDQVYDHKTGTLYLIEDQDHPLKSRESEVLVEATTR